MTETFFYRFETEQAALDAFEPIALDGRFYLDSIAVDVINKIYKPTGNVVVDVEGVEFPELAPLPWFHLNTTERLDGFTAFEVFPVTPYRVFM